MEYNNYGGVVELWGANQQGQSELDLASKMLQIQTKRFYLDMKQNRRGRFIKVAEIGTDGRRSQIFLALSTAKEFRDQLSFFSDYYSSLGPPNQDNMPDHGKLKSETILRDNRRYYLDLKENSRGRFLRVSQTISGGNQRSQIAIPAQGMIEFRDALTDLLDECNTDLGVSFRLELADGRHLQVDNKNFYFDIGRNTRGVYMRISEVKSNFRTAITLPEKSWTRFRDILNDYCGKAAPKPNKPSMTAASSSATTISNGSVSSAAAPAPHQRVVQHNANMMMPPPLLGNMNSVRGHGSPSMVMHVANVRTGAASMSGPPPPLHQQPLVGNLIVPGYESGSHGVMSGSGSQNSSGPPTTQLIANKN